MTHPFVSRRYTHQLLDWVEEGAIDKDMLIRACVGWMSEDEVRQMMLANDFIGNELD